MHRGLWLTRLQAGTPMMKAPAQLLLHLVEEARGPSRALTRTLILPARALSSGQKPKPLPPQTITFGARISAEEFWGCGDTNIRSRP